MDGGRRDGGGERERARAPKKQPAPQQPHHLFLSLSLLLLPRPARSPDATWYRPYDRPPAHLNLILSPTLAETGSQAALPARAGRPQATSIAEEGGERMGGGVGRVGGIRRGLCRACAAGDACGTAPRLAGRPGRRRPCNGVRWQCKLLGHHPRWHGRARRARSAWVGEAARAAGQEGGSVGGAHAGWPVRCDACVCVRAPRPSRPPAPAMLSLSLSLSLSACLLLAVAVVAAAARAARARVNFMACFLLLLGEMEIGVMFDWYHDPRSTPPKNEKQNYNRAGGRHAHTLDPAGGSPRHSLSLSQ